MLKMVSVLLQICFPSPKVCKQLSAPEPCRIQPSCFPFLFIARQQLGKSYKLFIRWLLAEIFWMLINSCDVWSPPYFVLKIVDCDWAVFQMSSFICCLFIDVIGNWCVFALFFLQSIKPSDSNSNDWVKLCDVIQKVKSFDNVRASVDAE